MDPALEPPLRMKFFHPGRSLSLFEAQANIANFLSNRAERLHASIGGAPAGAEADSITGPLMRLKAALQGASEREAREQSFVKP